MKSMNTERGNTWKLTDSIETQSKLFRPYPKNSTIVVAIVGNNVVVTLIFSFYKM